MPTIASILELPRPSPCTVEESLTVCEAIRQMNKLDAACMLVVDSHRCVVGIVTEHDLLVRVVAAALDPRSVRVGDVMTAELETIAPNSSLERAMEFMTARRYRQLLVAEDGQIQGVVTISDLTRALLSEREALIGDLTYYITHG